MPSPKDRIEPLLEKWEPAIRDAFLAAVEAIRSRAQIARLIELLKTGNVEGAIRAVGLEPASFRPLTIAMAQTYEAGGVDAMLGVKPTRGPLGLQIAPPFDVQAPQAEDWVRRRGADLIRQITEDQRTLIREALAPLFSGRDPMLTGETPQKIALDLVGRINRATGKREGGILGLTSGQAQWARNYEIELGDARAKVPPDPNALTRVLRDKRYDGTVARAIREGRTIPAETRQAMVSAYRNRALRYRGETIALNEASDALHASQIEAWDQAIARGAVAEDKVRRFWITAGDDKVRETHRLVPGMNADGVRLHDSFQTPKGPTSQPGWQFDPGCRCRVRVRVIEPA